MSKVTDFFSRTFGLLTRRIDFFQFFGVKGDRIMVNLSSMGGLEDIYRRCSPIGMLIDRLSRAMTNGKWEIIDEKNNPSTEYGWVIDLLKKPNYQQTTKQFITQFDTYIKLYGEVYLFLVVPVGMDKDKAASIWALRKNDVIIHYKENVNEYTQTDISGVIDHYQVTYSLGTIDVKPEHICRIVDTREDLGAGASRYRGISRLVSLEYEIKNVMQAQEAVYALNLDRGAMGILTNEAKDTTGRIPLTDEEKRDLHNEYRSKYGIGNNKYKIMLTSASMKWQSMSFNIKDLMLFEGIEQNLKQMANTYNYPFELLASNFGTTFANKNEAKKFLYQDNIIPTADIYAEILTAFFGITGVRLNVNFDSVECLQESDKEKGEAIRAKAQAYHVLFQNGAITMEEYRKYMGLPQEIEGDTYVSETTRTDNSIRITDTGTGMNPVDALQS